MDTQLEAILADHKLGLTQKEIAAKHGISRDAVWRRLQKAKNYTPPPPAWTGPGTVTPTNSYSDSGIPGTVEEAIQVWNDYIGYTGIPPATPTVTTIPGDRKIVLVNDLHAPFHDEAAVASLIREHAHDTDLLIIGGDLLDLFSVSRYEKYEQHFSLSEEFRSGKALLNLLASKFKKIKMIPGNHDERWKKHLVGKRGMGPAEITAMNLLGEMATGDSKFDITDPLYCLTRDLPNVELTTSPTKDYARFTFFMQEGDLIVSHAEKFSRLTGQTSAQSAQWFKSCAIPSGICRDFRVFAQTHNHQASWAWGNFGVWNIEAGCMCKTPDYAGSPKLMGAQRPSIVGYTVFYQDVNGRTDMRRSRFIPLEG